MNKVTMLFPLSVLVCASAHVALAKSGRRTSRYPLAPSAEQPARYIKPHIIATTNKGSVEQPFATSVLMGTHAVGRGREGAPAHAGARSERRRGSANKAKLGWL